MNPSGERAGLRVAPKVAARATAIKASAAAALLGLATVAVPAPLRAQVNIERLRRTAAGNGFSGAAGANLTARTGNVQLVLLTLNGRVDYTRPRWLAFAVGNTDVGWQGGQRFSNSGLLHVRYNYLATPAVAGEVFAQIDYDKARLLAFRAITGAGLRFTVHGTGSWRLAIGTAYMLEHERLDLPLGAPGPANTTVSRWSNYVSVSYGSAPRLATVATVYAQPRFDDFGDARILADARLAVQLVGSVSLTVSSHLRYDSQPPPSIRPVDTALTTGVTLEW
jgi:Protein of unknown function, DUF481